MHFLLSLVSEFHTKFHVPIADTPTLIPEDRANLRYRLMREEVEEYLAGTQHGDLENIAKELADILYTVYGTILEHGLQDIMEPIFAEVHRSNMTKEFGEHKIVKGAEYEEAEIGKIYTMHKHELP